MGKRSLPILIAAACALWAVPDARALTLDEAAKRVHAARAVQEPLVPLYAPDELRQDTGENLYSPWQAVGLSLLLPGAGQIYGGAPGRGKLFIGAEALVWGMALGFDRWSAWKKSDATDFAVEHAELVPAGKDDTFLEYLEFYDSRDEYNRAGRIIDPSRPYLAETRDTYWQWDSGDNRRIYRDLRNQSDAAGRNATFMVYVAVINRVVSAVDAFRVVRKNNARAKSERGLKLSWKPAVSLSNPGLKLDARLVF